MDKMGRLRQTGKSFPWSSCFSARMSIMPNPFAPAIVLDRRRQKRLEALTRAHSTPQALVFRCRLILRLAGL